jgi:hypothetical protein
MEKVRRPAAEKLFSSLMEAHHYLGYTRPVGEELKYLLRGQTKKAQRINAGLFSIVSAGRRRQ